MMTEYLRHYDIPFTVVATKDKLSKAQRGRTIPRSAGRWWCSRGKSSSFRNGRHWQERLPDFIGQECARREPAEADE